MTARLRAWLENLGDQFWLRPALVVVACMIVSNGAVLYDERTASSFDPTSSAFGYSGGGEGARSLLGVVASSSIGVASTIFSITIAALSLASGQMGPRLLRNFLRDGGNQIALGIFLGTFAYALLVLRTVRTDKEGAFVPHVGVAGAVVLAVLCLGTLIWFVHHIATSINVETVVDSVHRDLVRAIADKTADTADDPAPPVQDGGAPVTVTGSQFLQAIDLDGLADWALRNAVTVRVLVKPGAYVPPGVPVATVSSPVEGRREALDAALTFGRRRAALQDLEYPVRQLNEIAVRALSPGINDPFTAASVLDRFGDALCRIVPRHLPTGTVLRDGAVAVRLPATDYDGLCDAMFHTIRQNASGSAHVLIRLIEVLTRVAAIEPREDRRVVLRRHAGLAIAVARAGVSDPDGIADCERRFAAFVERS